MLDELDDAIIEILGNESPIIDGIGLPEADGMVHEVIVDVEKGEENKKSNKLSASKRKRIPFEDLKKELLETEIYKNKLKILKLEKEMNLEISKFTKDFKSMEESQIENEIANSFFSVSQI